MTSGPNTHNSMNALLSDMMTRLRLVERRLTIGQGISARIVGDDGVEVTGSGTVFDPVSIGLESTLVTNLDDAVRTGSYQAAGSATNNPVPGTAVALDVIEQGATIRQEVYTISAWPNTHRSYVRIYDGTTWSSWALLQPISGQVPGLKILYGSVSNATTINTLTGLNVSVTFTGGYFTAPPSCWGIFDNGRVTVAMQFASPPTTSGATFRLDNWSNGNMAGTYNLYWYAIGV